MLYGEKIIQLKSGKTCLFRSPKPEEDKSVMMDFLRDIAGETDFILRYPEECTDSPEQEFKFLENLNQSPDAVMIVCEIDGEIAGNCQVSFKTRLKTRHRAMVAIGLRQKFWNQGIGTAMFAEMIRLAKDRGILQLELEVIEGNIRARSLYEKMGFRLQAVHPNFIRLKDGTFRDEYYMIKQLG